MLMLHGMHTYIHACAQVVYFLLFRTSTANHTVLLTNINCQGYEDSLIHCDHEFGDNVCTYNEDVLLSCGKFKYLYNIHGKLWRYPFWYTYYITLIDDGEPEPDGRLRLVDGNNPSSGRLEILKNGLWGTVCSISFDKADADVACKQLGYNQSIQILEKLVYDKQHTSTSLCGLQQHCIVILQCTSLLDDFYACNQHSLYYASACSP